MIIFASVLLIQALFIAGYFLFRERIGLGALLVQLMFTAQYLLVEFDLGPFSLRVYLCGILILFALGSVQTFLHRLSSTPGATPILVAWLAYVGWYFVASLFNGNMEDTGAFLVSFLSVYILPTVVFVCMMAVLRTEADLHSSVIWLALIALANAAFSVMQSSGFSFAWAVHKLLFPIRAITTDDERLRVGNWFIDGWPPGLSSYSIATGFVMISFGILWVTFAAYAWHRRRFFLAACLFFAALLIEAGNVSSMSRSSIYLFPLGFMLALLLRNERGLRAPGLVFVGPGLVAVLIFAYSAKLVVEVNVSESRTIELDRIYDFRDTGRVDLIYQALVYSSNNIVFGGAEQALKSGNLAMTAHNAFVNALLISGAPGLILMLSLVFLILYYTYLLPTYSMPVRGVSGALAHGLSICILMYLGKGMLHSDSFSTGGTIGWYLLGLWVVARNLSLSNSR